MRARATKGTVVGIRATLTRGPGFGQRRAGGRGEGNQRSLGRWADSGTPVGGCIVVTTGGHLAIGDGRHTDPHKDYRGGTSQMFRKFTKKRLLIVASVTALALAGIAYAFFSSTGGGTGSAGVGSAGSALTLHGSI